MEHGPYCNVVTFDTITVFFLSHTITFMASFIVVYVEFVSLMVLEPLYKPREMED